MIMLSTSLKIAVTPCECLGGKFLADFTWHLVYSRVWNQHRFFHTFAWKAVPKFHRLYLNMCYLYMNLYLCESTFSIMKWAYIESWYCLLTNAFVYHLLQLVTTKINVDISNLLL
jgi:hypothetical protein